MDYQDFSTILLSILAWWAILLLFQRVSNRYPHKNSFKKDMIITLVQSIVAVLIFFPLLSYLLK